MSRIMKMRYEDMDRMSDMLIQSAGQLREVQEQMVAMARLVEQGALVGQGGDMLRQAVGNTLPAAIDRLATKLEERAKYVQKEKIEHQIAVGQSGSQYS